MKRITPAMLLGFVILGGCHCSPWTDRYATRIDRWNEHEAYAERWYVPRWDLNRIGQPDGICAGRCGRHLHRPPGPYVRPDRCTLHATLGDYVHPVDAWSVYLPQDVATPASIAVPPSP